MAACGGSAFSTAPGAGDGGGTGSSSGGAGSGSGSSSGSSSGAASDGGGTPDGPAAVEAGVGEAGAVAGGIEGGVAYGGPVSAGVRCGDTMTCGTATPVCCITSAGPQCAHLECGCSTQLQCANDADCAATALSCCIQSVTDATCAAGHFVARCAAGCTNGAQHLCDPTSPDNACGAGRQCSTSGGDLQSVGLPQDGVYGVCK